MYKNYPRWSADNTGIIGSVTFETNKDSMLELRCGQSSRWTFSTASQSSPAVFSLHAHSAAMQPYSSPLKTGGCGKTLLNMLLTLLERRWQLGTFQDVIALSGVMSDENGMMIMNGVIFSS